MPAARHAQVKDAWLRGPTPASVFPPSAPALPAQRSLHRSGPLNTLWEEGIRACKNSPRLYLSRYI